MRKKKLTEFEALIGKINLKYNGPPYEYYVTVNGVKKVMSGFSEQHIRDQLGNKKSTRNAKVRKMLLLQLIKLLKCKRNTHRTNKCL